ncbi:hypothetical protein [Serratia marcescens]|uniref:hypothetical protein n=1 Tax=Serratia marcescens TaxID=615 RepID=UPI003F821EDA
MDNKLSELSKPVMYSITCNGVVEEIGGDSQGFVREEVQAELDSWENGSVGIPDGYSVSALYSQEYVSDLIQRAERLDSMLTESVQALKAVEQRNAELEAKLATPVRLPDARQSSSGDRYQWSDGAHNYRLDVISMLLDAGFTVIVEGVE